MTNPRPIVGRNLYEELMKAGIATPLTRRVIIDIPHNDVVSIFVENLGDERMVDIIVPLRENGFEIKSPSTKETESGEHSTIGDTGPDSSSGGGSSGKHHE